MALRPGAERRGDHGLFSASDENIVLDRVANEVANHKGNVWSHVISLRREDAIRLGYDSSDRWRELLKRHIADIAKQTRIPLCNLKWYGAYHDTTHHPHIHLIVYSTNPKQGFLTKQGIDKIRSVFANDIFHDDLQSIYQELTQKRDELKVKSKRYVQNILNQISQNQFDDENLKQLIKTLHSQLKNCKGKRVYGYLSAEIKSTVNEIFEQLARDKNIQSLHEKWCELERQKYMTYTQKEKIFPPLYDNKTFHSVRNMIIKQVLEMGLIVSGIGFDEPDLSDGGFDFTVGETDEIEFETPDLSYEKEFDDITSKPYIKWSDGYKKACKLMYKKNASAEEILQAESLFLSETDKGNMLATHDLGKLYSAEKLGLKDEEKSFSYYKKAFEGFEILEPTGGKLQTYLQYRLGKMYFYGLGIEQDYAQALDWFLKSAESGNQFAQYSLGSMYYYGNGVEKDLSKAFYWYEKSAKQNNPYAAYSLARMYHYGEFAEKNMKKAQVYYKIAYDGFSAIEYEDDNLWYKLGCMCKKGLGTDVNIPRAMEYFKAAAELQNKNALCEYGIDLIKGENVNQDIEIGIKMLEKALEKGNLNAAYHLGKLYMDGEFVYMDLRKAEKYLLLSAEKSGFAQYRLGKLYLKDEFYNLSKAVQWLEKAITNDNQYAKYALAKIFIGEDQYRNIPRAVELLESIAEENHWASFMLGRLYLFGAGDFPRDEELAVKWLVMSAEQGNEYAQNLLSHVNDFENAMLANTVMSLFVSLSRCIADNYNQKFQLNKVSVDKKLRRVIRDKKVAMGVKYENQMY